MKVSIGGELVDLPSDDANELIDIYDCPVIDVDAATAYVAGKYAPLFYAYIQRHCKHTLADLIDQIAMEDKE